MSGLGTRALGIGYCALFFAFLFGPLVIMVITAFNSSPFPRIAPWDCFTTDWFEKLAGDRRLVEGLWNSLVIGAGVVLVATPVGLAGALALSEVGDRLRPVLYGILLTPLLAPGVVIGISTLIFWDRIAAGAGAGHGSLLYSGTFLTILGQVTFIAAYAMLIFLARLQRFDRTLTEAALDLGASPGQAFRKILLPFLRPAIGSAAVLAFLSSVENYNTTVFTIVSGSTFTTVLASKVRFGIDPSLSAVAVIIIALTLVAAIVHEAHARRAERLRRGGPAARRLLDDPVARVATHPATVGLVLAAVLAGAVWLGARHDSDACEAALIEAKRAEQQRLLDEQRKRLQPAAAPAGPSGAASPGAPPAAPVAPTKPASPFGGAFAPGNLGGEAAPADGAAAPAAPATPPPVSPATPTKPASPFGGAFAPESLTGSGTAP